MKPIAVFEERNKIFTYSSFVTVEVGTEYIFSTHTDLKMPRIAAYSWLKDAKHLAGNLASSSLKLRIVQGVKGRPSAVRL